MQTTQCATTVQEAEYMKSEEPSLPTVGPL